MACPRAHLHRLTPNVAVFGLCCVCTAMQTWKTPNGLEPKTPVETYKGDDDDWAQVRARCPPFAFSAWRYSTPQWVVPQLPPTCAGTC